jgi:hypothetical protein
MKRRERLQRTALFDYFGHALIMAGVRRRPSIFAVLSCRFRPKRGFNSRGARQLVTSFGARESA